MTICASCRWLSEHAKGASWTTWKCMASPTDEINPVTGEAEIYVLCRFLNKGDCPAFEAGSNCLRPKEA